MVLYGNCQGVDLFFFYDYFYDVTLFGEFYATH